MVDLADLVLTNIFLRFYSPLTLTIVNERKIVLLSVLSVLESPGDVRPCFYSEESFMTKRFTTFPFPPVVLPGP